MSLKLAWTIVIILGFSTAPTQAAGKVSDGDIILICNRVADVCVAACKRKDNFTGQLSEGLCIDDCIRTHTECVGPTQEKRNGIDGTTGVPEGGNATMEQGQKQKKKRKKAVTQP